MLGPVLYRNRPKKVFYYTRVVDFRKQAMGLASLVDVELPGELKEGHWFVFISGDKKKAKILYWRGTGIALWQLRLERESFKVDRSLSENTSKISWRDLGRLLDGLNIFEGEAHQNRKPKRFA